MSVYSEATILLGSTQACLKELSLGNMNQVLQQAGKAEGLAQALFDRSVKEIYHNFQFSREDIDRWTENKKIFDFHKDAFLKYAEK